MNKAILISVMAVGVAAVYTFIPKLDTSAAADTKASEEIKWLTWQEAIKQAEQKPKKIFVDVYTDWCGWCKRMDATTFKDASVVKYMNENFYPVKLDAEQKEEIQYRGYTLKYIASGRRGVHELAYSLLDGQLGYPSYVYLDEEQNRITISPGYKPAEPFLLELKWIGGNHYQTKTFEEFQKTN